MTTPSEHLEALQRGRLKISESPGLVQIKVPCRQLIPVTAILILAGCAVAASWWILLGIPALCLRVALTSRETLEITPDVLRYRVGLWPVVQREFEWSHIRNLRQGREGMRTHAIWFEYEKAPYLGSIFSICRNLTSDEAPKVFAYLQSQQAAKAQAMA